MLSKDEFARFNGRSLTNVCVDRIWEETRMFKSPDTDELEMVDGRSVCSTAGPSDGRATGLQGVLGLHAGCGEQAGATVDPLFLSPARCRPSRLPHAGHTQRVFQGASDPRPFTPVYYFATQAIIQKMIDLGLEPVDVADVISVRMASAFVGECRDT